MWLSNIAVVIGIMEDISGEFLKELLKVVEELLTHAYFSVAHHTRITCSAHFVCTCMLHELCNGPCSGYLALY